jgi:transcription termination factor NusB
MKTAKDPRHLKREAVIKELFSWGFTETFEPKTKEAKDILKNLDKIDKNIVKGAPTWPLTQVNRIDLAILRLAVFELIIVKDTPFKVIVDEAVEMAKKYGSESSPGFVNGVLGNLIDSSKLDKERKKDV